MYLIGEPSYRESNWYARILSPLKALARKKRVNLCEADGAAVAEGEECALVLGGSVRWITETVCALCEMGVHPVVLSEIPDGTLTGRYSRVRTDYHRFVLRATGETAGRVAFYGMNPASLSDLARRDAFLAVHPAGEVFENVGALGACFDAFLACHEGTPFTCVICANELAAVSLVHHLRRVGGEMPAVAVHAAAEILSHFPEIRSSHVSPAALAGAAFAIVDCVRQSREFLGMEITVEDEGEESEAEPMLRAREGTPDGFWADGELHELMCVDRLLSGCDETDRTILRLLCERRRDIGEEAYLSDNGVKYRIKKMKRICEVESKSEIVALLEKYGIII